MPDKKALSPELPGYEQNQRSISPYNKQADKRDKLDEWPRNQSDGMGGIHILVG